MRDFLKAEPVTIKSLPASLTREWVLPDGRAGSRRCRSGDPNDNGNLRVFARAVLAVYPTAIGGPISILRSADTIVTAFLQAGACALISITLLLWIVLRRFVDVLLTIVPLLMPGLLTLEICVLIGLPLNFANIIALPLLLGVGVAFKIYYIMAWRSGQTDTLAIKPDPRGDLERTDHGDRLRQPVAVQPSGNLQHGQAAGALAGLYPQRRGAISARADGKPAQPPVAPRKTLLPNIRRLGRSCLAGRLGLQRLRLRVDFGTGLDWNPRPVLATAQERQTHPCTRITSGFGSLISAE